MPLQCLVDLVCDDCDAEIAIVLNEPGHLVQLTRLRDEVGPVASSDGLLHRRDECGREIVDAAADRVDDPQDGLYVVTLVRRAGHDFGYLRMHECDPVVDELGQPARHQPHGLVAIGIEVEGDVRGAGIVCAAAQDGLLNAQDRRKIMAFPHPGEELGDVRRVEALAKQLVDGLQLRQVVVVVERRAALPAWRVEQAALTVGADVARADTRDPREVVQSILSQPGAPRVGRGDGYLACGHCSTADAILSEVVAASVRM